MGKVLTYVGQRLKEPGTLRALIAVVAGIAGYSLTDNQVAEICSLVIMGLGGAAAARPETSTKVLDAVKEVKERVGE